MQESTSDLSQVSIVIAITACYDVCDDPSQWGPGTVLYEGPFNPQHDSSAPQEGLHQAIHLPFPGQSWPAGESVLSVSHLFNVGVRRVYCCSMIPTDLTEYQARKTLVFDYADVHVQVVDN